MVISTSPTVKFRSFAKAIRNSWHAVAARSEDKPELLEAGVSFLAALDGVLSELAVSDAEPTSHGPKRPLGDCWRPKVPSAPVTLPPPRLKRSQQEAGLYATEAGVGEKRDRTCRVQPALQVAVKGTLLAQLAAKRDRACSDGPQPVGRLQGQPPLTLQRRVAACPPSRQRARAAEHGTQQLSARSARPASTPLQLKRTDGIGQATLPPEMLSQLSQAALLDMLHAAIERWLSRRLFKGAVEVDTAVATLDHSPHVAPLRKYIRPPIASVRDFIINDMQDVFILVETGNGQEIQRAPAVAEEMQHKRELVIADFLASLPQDGFTDEEEVLRDAILTFLRLWPKRDPPQLSEFCQIGSEATNAIVFARWNLLPRQVGLQDWIVNRIGEEIELFEGKGPIPLVRLSEN